MGFYFDLEQGIQKAMNVQHGPKDPVPTGEEAVVRQGRIVVNPALMSFDDQNR
jgi:hypothetical protein